MPEFKELKFTVFFAGTRGLTGEIGNDKQVTGADVHTSNTIAFLKKLMRKKSVINGIESAHGPGSVYTVSPEPEVKSFFRRFKDGAATALNSTIATAAQLHGRLGENNVIQNSDQMFDQILQQVMQLNEQQSERKITLNLIGASRGVISAEYLISRIKHAMAEGQPNADLLRKYIRKVNVLGIDPVIGGFTDRPMASLDSTLWNGYNIFDPSSELPNGVPINANYYHSETGDIRMFEGFKRARERPIRLPVLNRDVYPLNSIYSGNMPFFTGFIKKYGNHFFFKGSNHVDMYLAEDAIFDATKGKNCKEKLEFLIGRINSPAEQQEQQGQDYELTAGRLSGVITLFDMICQMDEMGVIDKQQLPGGNIKKISDALEKAQEIYKAACSELEDAPLRRFVGNSALVSVLPKAGKLTHVASQNVPPIAAVRAASKLKDGYGGEHRGDVPPVPGQTLFTKLKNFLPSM